MFYIEAPNSIPDSIPAKPKLFLAGGITGCPDWQTELRELLINEDITVFNPRRKSFDVKDADAARLQIEWEHRHLHGANAISFWFPCETLNPITLFELGAWSHWRNIAWNANTKMSEGAFKPLFVGVHPDYARRADVEIQISLQRPDVTVVDNLEDLAWLITQWGEGKTPQVIRP